MTGARTVVVQIRMTPGEHEALRLAAAAAGLPLGTWLRVEALRRAGTDLAGLSHRPAPSKRRGGGR